MQNITSQPLPLLTLNYDEVFLPGAVRYLPISARKDIYTLLALLLRRNGITSMRTEDLDVGSAFIGCVFTVPDSWKAEAESIGGEMVVGKKRVSQIGTVASIVAVEGRGTGGGAILIRGFGRFRVEKMTRETPFLEAQVTYHYDGLEPGEVVPRALFVRVKSLSRELATLLRRSAFSSQRVSLGLPPSLARRLELVLATWSIQDAGMLADFMSSLGETSPQEKLGLLAAWDVKDRLEKVLAVLSRQIASLAGGVQATPALIKPDVGEEIERLDRIHQVPFARRPLGNNLLRDLPLGFSMNQRHNNGQEGNDLDELQQKLDNAKLTVEAKRVAEREMKRLRRMNSTQAEYQVSRTYLEILAEVPWSNFTEDRLGADVLTRARKQLDDDHYGLEKIKRRLIEYIAVLKLKRMLNADMDAGIDKPSEHIVSRLVEPVEEDQGQVGDKATSEPKPEPPEFKPSVDRPPIILLVGPPGTGKTSLAKSIATAMGRRFHRISLGGVRDEAEIRGHRRTYVAALPGLIVNGLRKVGCANPVFLLDEIDKVGRSSPQGDPSAAMLEVLDPEQNHTFTDHYLAVPLDLSKVLFIATANSLDTIPPPLLDRMETISLSGYTLLEKREIAIRHLIPKQITNNGLKGEQVHFTHDVIDKIITAYTRESGVRNLEREIGAVCRAKAVQYADAQDSLMLDTYRPDVSLTDLDSILGVERYDEEIAEKVGRPGVVTGLAAYSTGGNGGILFVEVADMPGNGRVQLTGKLGDVLKESVEVALTWVKAHAYELGLADGPSDDIMKNRNLHVHCPVGAVPKDGPSAGLAHSIAIISLLSGRVVPPTLAMTGEISLRGRITAVGGVKEKLIGGLRAGVKTVILPAPNRKDERDLPREVKDGLNIVYVRHIWEALRHIWPDVHWPGEDRFAGTESRL